MKRKYKPFFDNKICDICGEKANTFRVIESKIYMLCDTTKCDFIIRNKHGWNNLIIGK